MVDALREIFAERCQKFDPTIVNVFVEIVRGLQRTHPDLQAYLSERLRALSTSLCNTLKRAAEHALTNG